MRGRLQLRPHQSAPKCGLPGLTGLLALSTEGAGASEAAPLFAAGAAGECLPECDAALVSCQGATLFGTLVAWLTRNESEVTLDLVTSTWPCVSRRAGDDALDCLVAWLTRNESEVT